MAEEEVKEDKPRFSKRLALPLVGAAACGVAYRCGVVPSPMQAFLRAQSLTASCVALAGNCASSRLVVEPLNRIMLRLIDFGVPAAVVVITLLALSDDEDSEDFDDDANNPSLLRTLLKGRSAPERSLTKPPRELVRIERLSDRLSSFAYTLDAATGSRADALAAERRRQLQRRFRDDLGSWSASALAGLASAEKAWRVDALKSARAAEAARAEVRAISVKLGGETEAPAATALPVTKRVIGGGRERKETRELRERLKRAEERLSKALKKHAEHEATFLRAASAALGPSEWEARASLVALAARPPSWDPRAPPLETVAGTGGGVSTLAAAEEEEQGEEEQGAADEKQADEPEAPAPAASPRAFVLDFPGDVQASGVAALRQEVTAIVGSADASRGDRVVVRLESGGGTVTGYGLAAAQLLRIKQRGLPLVVCVEQVAASGGYMMACVADTIIASPFAVLGSIGVLTEQPNIYERLKKEGVQFNTVTAGQYKRTLTPFKKVEEADLAKTREEVTEIFNLFKAFVGRHRPTLDLDRVATGETWFGEDALQRGLCDELRTFDDVLLDLHAEGVEAFSVRFKPQPEGPLERLGLRADDMAAGTVSTMGAKSRLPWPVRLLLAAFGLPSKQHKLRALLDDTLDDGIGSVLQGSAMYEQDTYFDASPGAMAHRVEQRHPY